VHAVRPVRLPLSPSRTRSERRHTTHHAISLTPLCPPWFAISMCQAASFFSASDRCSDALTYITPPPFCVRRLETSSPPMLAAERRRGDRSRQERAEPPTDPPLRSAKALEGYRQHMPCAVLAKDTLPFFLVHSQIRIQLAA
jgi:hypothetical protein